jgi:hypothetical protein
MHYSVITYLKLIASKAIIKAIVIGFLNILIFSISTNGQEKVSFFHVKGMQAVEIVGGISDLGTAGSVFYSVNLSTKWYGKAGITYEVKKLNRYKAAAITADLCLARTMIFKRNFFLSLLAGGSLVIDESLTGLDNNEGKMPYGFMSGIEMEYYLFNHLAIISSSVVRFIINSELGRERFYLQAGLKFTF